MKIIEVKFTEKEINIMHDLFFHAIEGFGIGTYIIDEDGNKKELSYNAYKNIEDKLFSCQNEGVIAAPNYTWVDFISAYIDCCNAIGVTEMQTLTGYEWEEVITLQKRLTEAVVRYN